VGDENRFGHPREAVLTRLSDIPIYRTDQQGSIRFSFVKGEWLLSCGKTCITQQ